MLLSDAAAFLLSAATARLHFINSSTGKILGKDAKMNCGVSCFAHFRLPFRAIMDGKLTSRGRLQWSATSTTPILLTTGI